MTLEQYGRHLAAGAPALTAEQGEAMARILATVEPQEAGAA